MSNWEHNKQHALKLLHRLLGVWQGQPKHLLDNITTTGIQANMAVNELQLQTDLPLPYDDEKMPDNKLMLHQPRPINGTEDKVSKNIRAWIRAIEEYSLRGKRQPWGDDTPPEQKAMPGDLISMAVALSEFVPSRSTLTRAVRDRRIKSYRPPKAPPNASHIFSRAELKAIWPERS